jgi:segregation and condensation protein B
MAIFQSSTGCLLRSVALRYRGWGRRSGWSNTSVGSNRLTLWAVKFAEDATVAGGTNTRDERLAALEAVLFLVLQPMSSRKLAQLAGLADGTKARTLVRTLNRMYDAQGCAFRIEEVAGGFQLMSRAKFAPWLRRLHAAWIEVRLSAPAMETLAVVAYRQPILRAEIEAIRGVQSGEVLRQLIERDLVRIVGRSEELGRPYLYGTSKRFLQIFGLKHIEELPNYSPEAKEETNVKTLTTTKAHPEEFATESMAVLMEPKRSAPAKLQSPRALTDEDEDEDEDEDDDFDDLDEDEDEDEEEEEDEDLEEEEPWEEVDDVDEEEEDEEDEDDDDEDWDDEDWDDDDWDEDDDDWDEDEDEDDEEEEEEEEEKE